MYFFMVTYYSAYVVQISSCKFLFFQVPDPGIEPGILHLELSTLPLDQALEKTFIKKLLRTDEPYKLMGLRLMGSF